MRNFKSFLEEKTLTPAEKKKREEIAKAIERDNPDMPMAKKMAIATATAKKVAEEAEQIDEKGLWDNIWAKRRAGKKMRKPGSKGAPTDADFKRSQKDESVDEAKGEWKKDSGWHKPEAERKDKFGNVIKTKNVAKNLAKSAAKTSATMKKESVELEEYIRKNKFSKMTSTSKSNTKGVERFAIINDNDDIEVYNNITKRLIRKVRMSNHQSAVQRLKKATYKSSLDTFKGYQMWYKSTEGGVRFSDVDRELEEAHG